MQLVQEVALVRLDADGVGLYGSVLVSADSVMERRSGTGTYKKEDISAVVAAFYGRVVVPSGLAEVDIIVTATGVFDGLVAHGQAATCRLLKYDVDDIQ